MTKSESSRINGAKSRGPKTPAGRARSSQNARRHGALVNPIFLRNENPQAFDALEREYLGRYQPDGPVERKLVDDLIICEWRQRRITASEAAAIDHQMDRDEIKISREFSDIDEATRTAVAIKELSNTSRELDVQNRYDARFQRQYLRALQTLRELQRERKVNLPNEPAAASNNTATEPRR